MKALAVKYRPRSLDDVVGQEAVLQMLSNAFDSGYVPSAFLFTGHHGVGKTTLARVIARSAMCERGISSSPCGNCEHCLEIAASCHPDVLEVDAASNTGINDVKLIIENANYVPLKGRFKIFIVDEVHMLSVSAFNALLKTLEEPKDHVKFVFATTELRKVPLTVVSRCQLMQLQRVNDKKIADRLGKILAWEGVKHCIDEQAIMFIAVAARGSLRDAITLLEQSLLYSQNQQSISIEELSQMLGTVSPSALNTLLGCIINQDAESLTHKLHELYLKAHDPAILIENLMRMIYKEVISKITGGKSSKLTLPPTTTEKLLRLWQAMLSGLKEVKSAPDAYLASEMLLLRLCYLSSLPSIAEILEKENKRNNPEDNPLDSDLVNKIIASFENARIKEVI